MRNDVFFFVVIFGAAALLVFCANGWRCRARRPAALPAANDAERRRLSWERRKQSRWMFAAAVVLRDRDPDVRRRFRVRARRRRSSAGANAARRRATWCVFPIADVSDGNLHFFRVEVNGTSLRFIVIHKPDGSWGTALDACMICGWAGYKQDGSEHDLPQLRFGDLRAHDRPAGRVQSRGRCRRKSRDRTW